jgi:hypothetical protein
LRATSFFARCALRLPAALLRECGARKFLAGVVRPYNCAMRQKYPHDFKCEECGSILRALLDSFHVDRREMRQRLKETAQASGRGLEEMRNVWRASVSKMPPDEMRTLMRAHFPRAVEARRKKVEHEALTGHSVHVHGWALVFGRRPFGGRAPRSE